jgi:hypothetical protein
MFLIFNLLRPDVLPLDDIGLLRAIALKYPVQAPGPDGDGEAPAPVCRIPSSADPAAGRSPGRKLAPLALGGHLVPVAQPRSGVVEY